MCVYADKKDIIKENIKNDFRKNIQNSIDIVDCAEVILRCLKKTIIDKRKEEENDNTSQ